MPQVQKASKYEREQCVSIHSSIDDYIPESGYTRPIQERLAAKGYQVSRERIANTRKLRVKDLRIMRELYDFVVELYPLEFSEFETGLSK